MKKLFLLGILCFSVCLCAGCSDDDEIATSILYGVVRDDTAGKPIANATVVLSPGGATKTTGTDGVYCFEKLDVQQYTITAQKSGYQTNRKSVTAVAGERIEVNITLYEIQ
ncbi:MAG: carboxypeptidase-like regulatory domain-containing protein [Alistipes sp.]|nr:carboxypeptidase-like regulatory domain-containing protein [Alistipes sp.]